MVRREVETFVSVGEAVVAALMKDLAHAVVTEGDKAAQRAARSPVGPAALQAGAASQGATRAPRAATLLDQAVRKGMLALRADAASQAAPRQGGAQSTEIVVRPSFEPVFHCDAAPGDDEGGISD